MPNGGVPTQNHGVAGGARCTGSDETNTLFDNNGFDGGMSGGGMAGGGLLQTRHTLFTKQQCIEEDRCFWCGEEGHTIVTHSQDVSVNLATSGEPQKYTCPRHPHCDEGVGAHGRASGSVLVSELWRHER